SAASMNDLRVNHAKRRDGMRRQRAVLDRLNGTRGNGAIRWSSYGTLGGVCGFSPDDQRLVSVSEWGEAFLWDVDRGEAIASLGIHSPALFAPWFTLFRDQPVLIDAAAARSPSHNGDAAGPWFCCGGESVLIFDHGAGRASIWDGRHGEWI